MVDPSLMKYAKQRSATGHDAESPSLLGKVAGGVLGPISAIGNVLDLPGSSVRDVLAGKNPFDQYLTPTRDDNRSSGRDVLTAWGLTKPNDPHRWEEADVGGFLSEVALDPLTYLSFGGSALTKAGRLAKMAGVLPKTRLGRIEGTLRQALKGQGRDVLRAARDAAKANGLRLRDIADQRLGNLFNVALPFTESVNGITGGAAGKYLAGGMDKIGAAVAASPVGRAARMTFDPSVKGAYTPEGQRLGELMFEAGENSTPKGKLSAYASDQLYDNAKSTFQTAAPDVTDSQFAKVMSLAQERIGTGEDYAGAAAHAIEFVTKKQPTPEMVQNISEAAKSFYGAEKVRHAELSELGIKVGTTPSGDKFSYGVRSASEEFLNAKEIKRTREGDLSAPMTKRRRTMLQSFPQVFMDTIQENPKRYAGKRNAPNILQDFGENLGYNGWTRDKTTNQMVPKYFTPEEHAVKLASYARRVGKLSGKPKVYNIDPRTHHANYLKSTERIAENARSIHQFFGEALTSGQKGTVKLKDAYKQIGMDPQKSLEYLSRASGKLSPEQLGKMKVPQQFVDAAMATRKPQGIDNFFKIVMGKYDELTQKYFKTPNTVPWPDFHIRNFIGGQYNWLASGHIKNRSDAMKYRSKLSEAVRLFNEGEKNQKVREALAYGVLNPFQAAEDIPVGSGDIADKQFWNVPKTYGQVKDRNTAAPWAAEKFPVIGQGVTAGRNAVATGMESGKKAAAATEYMNRFAGYLYLRDKGYSPRAAAKEVELLQFNYEKATPAERKYFKRMMPFYTFQSRNLALTAKTLAERPGGLTGQMMRAISSARSPEEVMPQHIANTAAIPLGEQPDGSNRYITGFGLPFEAASPYLAALTGDYPGAILEGMAGMNPAIKAPLEAGTGMTFFQRGPTGGGRQLEDLDPTVGRLMSSMLGREKPVNWMGGSKSATQQAEHMIGNSPLSKALTKLRGLSDARKGLATRLNNLLLPWRATDISPQQQEYALQSAAKELAKEMGAKKWESLYFRKEDIAEMEKTDPETAAQMKELERLFSAAKAKAAKLKAEKEKARTNPETGRANPLLRMIGR